MSQNLAILKATLTQKLQRIPKSVLDGSIQDVRYWLDVQKKCSKISQSKKSTEEQILKAIETMESFE